MQENIGHNEENSVKGKVAIICATESFLAKSLTKKLESSGIRAEFMHASIKELEKSLSGTELIILFMSEEIDDAPEVTVYLKDTIQEKGIGLYLIGEDEQYEQLIKVMPEQDVTEWFKRPLDIDGLIKKVGAYLSDNTGDKRKKTVLIVDDDITYMRTVYEWLKESYHVGMAASGVQAIAYLAKNKADLILLDYEMPIVDGPQVFTMLKSDSDIGNIPVMFLTGHGDKESVMSVVDLKPVDYLLKSIGKQKLLDKLELFFAKQQQ